MSDDDKRTLPVYHCEKHDEFLPGCNDCRGSRPDRAPRGSAMMPDQAARTLQSVSKTVLEISTRYSVMYAAAHTRPEYGVGNGGSGTSKPTESAFLISRGNRELVEDTSHAIESAYTAISLGLSSLLRLEARIDEAHPLTPGIHERQRERPAERSDIAVQYRNRAKALIKQAEKIERQLEVEARVATKRVPKKARRRSIGAVRGMTLETFTFTRFTENQSGDVAPSAPLDESLCGGSPVASTSCIRCTAQPVVADDRCRNCYQFKYRNGYDRPDDLIVANSERHELKRTGRSNGVLDATEAESMTQQRYTGPLATADDCSCGCGRVADNFKTTDGLSPYCRNLMWHRTQRAS